MLPRTVTFAQGATTASFYIRAVADSTTESGEGLRLDFGTLPSNVRKGTWGPYEIIQIVEALDTLIVRFGAASYTAVEGGADAEVAINLHAPVDVEPVDVGLDVAYGGTASAADHSTIPSSVRFAVGEQRKTFTISATDDSANDDGESITLSFVYDHSGRLDTTDYPSTTTVALDDNDGVAPVTVSFGSAAYTATEGGAGATVSVNLDAAPGRAIDLTTQVTYGGGASSSDTSTIPATVSFGATETAKTFTVTATSDGSSDGGETVVIGFRNLPEGVTTGTPATTTITLADGTEQSLVVDFSTAANSNPIRMREADVLYRIGLLLNTAARRPVTIPLVVTYVGGATADDHSAIPETVTIAAGRTSGGFNMRLIPDQEDETDEGVRLDFGTLPPGVRKGTWGPYEIIEFVDEPSASISIVGSVLTIGFPDELDTTSIPSPRDFVVLTKIEDGAHETVSIKSVKVNGSNVRLHINRPVTPDEIVTLSYLDAAMHPILDVTGVAVPALIEQSVMNLTDAPIRYTSMSSKVNDTRTTTSASQTDLALDSTEVTRLDLSSQDLSDLSLLAAYTGLSELILRDNKITDLSPLARMTHLEVLDLGNNEISDLSPLASLSELRVLNLADNRISELWSLASLPNLRRLNLADNDIVDINAVADMDGIRVLELSNNLILDLWPLAALISIERLGLSGNYIEDLQPLSDLETLRVLLLDRNQIVEVMSLSKLVELENIGLSQNRISDVHALEGMTKLRRLDLADNAVQDLAPLLDGASLLWLRLSGNPTSDASPLRHHENLRWLWLER